MDGYINSVATRTRAKKDEYIKYKHNQLIQQGLFSHSRAKQTHNFTGHGDAPQIEIGDGQVKKSEENEEDGSKQASKPKSKRRQGHGDASNKEQTIGNAENEVAHSNMVSKPKRACYEGINGNNSDYLASKHVNNARKTDATIHSEKSNLRSNEGNGSSNFKNVGAEVNTEVLLLDYSSDSSSSDEENDGDNSFSSSDPLDEDSADAMYSGDSGSSDEGEAPTVSFKPRTRGIGVSHSRFSSQISSPPTQKNTPSGGIDPLNSSGETPTVSFKPRTRGIGVSHSRFSSQSNSLPTQKNTPSGGIDLLNSSDTSCSSTKAGSKRKFKKSLAKVCIDAEEEETLNAAIGDSMLDKRVTDKQNQANPFLPVNNHNIPLKFSFEDEAHLQDKTEFDNMVEDLFTEMTFAETCHKTGSNPQPRGKGVSNSWLTSQAKGPATQNNPSLVHIELSDSSDRESSIPSKDNVIVVGTNIESEEHGGPDLGSKNAESDAKKQKIKSKEGLTNRRWMSASDDSNIFKGIVDSILDEGSIDEQNEVYPLSTVDTHALPLKFMFEDEVEPPKKTEFENMVADLFTEMTFGERVDNIGSFANVLSEETENQNVLKNKMTRLELCRNDMHQVVLNEEIGLVCIYCHLVAREIRYVMPPFKISDSTMSERENFLYKKENAKFDGSQFANPNDDSSGDWWYKQSNMNGTVWDAVPGIRDKIYPHQAEGLEFIWKNLEGTILLNELKVNNSNGVGGCIISHAPGTGKTRLAIVFIETYLKIFPKCRPVIIAPASMLLTWEEEFQKWKVNFPFHNLNNSDLSGKENELPSNLFHSSLNLTAKERRRLVKFYSWGKSPSILGVSYNLYEKLARGESFVGTMVKSKLRKAVGTTKNSEWGELLLNLPGLVILDEGHTARNEKSGIWNILTKLHTKKRIILSGTPFQNNFGELFNTLHIVRPDIVKALAENKTFVEANRKYRRINSGQGKNTAPLKGSAEIWDAPIKMLKEVIAPFVHVYKGSILQQNLPGLMNSVIILNPHSFQKQIMDIVEFQNTFEDERKLALVSTHPSLIDRCTLSSKEKSTIPLDELKSYALNPNMGVKTRFIAELVNLSVSLNEKVLVFSQYVDPLGFINDQLINLFKWSEGIEVLHMQGKMDQKQRQRIMEDFNNPKSNAKVLLASIKCCSEGINLVGASRVVLLDVTWNPSVERQAISRAYRLGQKKVVHTYHLIMGGTAERKKMCRQAEKGLLSERMFSSNNKDKYNSDDHNKQWNDLGLNDKVLEAFCENNSLKGMFEKIIYQPHEAELIENFS